MVERLLLLLLWLLKMEKLTLLAGGGGDGGAVWKQEWQGMSIQTWSRMPRVKRDLQVCFIRILGEKGDEDDGWD